MDEPPHIMEKRRQKNSLDNFGSKTQYTSSIILLRLKFDGTKLEILSDMMIHLCSHMFGLGIRMGTKKSKASFGYIMTEEMAEAT